MRYLSTEPLAPAPEQIIELSPAEPLDQLWTKTATGLNHQARTQIAHPTEK